MWYNNDITANGGTAMVSQKVKVKFNHGFQIQTAEAFASAMGKFKSDIYILTNGNKVNAKSLMNIVAANIRCGAELEIVCSGEDETEALTMALELIETDEEKINTK